MEDEREAFRGLDVTRLTGVTYRQLDYWEHNALIVPSIEPAAGSGSRRLYSFEDLLCFAVVKQLIDAGFTVEFARRVLEKVRAEERPRTVPVISGQIEITVWLREIERRLRKKLAVTELVTSEEPLPQNSEGKLLPLSKLR